MAQSTTPGSAPGSEQEDLPAIIDANNPRDILAEPTGITAAMPGLPGIDAGLPEVEADVLAPGAQGVGYGGEGITSIDEDGIDPEGFGGDDTTLEPAVTQ